MAVPPLPSGPGTISGHPDKPALRERLRATRAAFVAGLGEDGRARRSADAADRLMPHIAEAAIVAVYLSIGDEIDPAPLAAALHARGQALALPHLVDRTQMFFRAWRPGDAIERGPFRLRQPLATAPECAPEVIVTPLVGFDRAGGRIGQGASHYDRAFARFPGARRVGFAWSVQEVPALPHDPWDVALDAVVTEQEWIVVP